MAYDDALFQLGMDLTRSSTAQKEDHGLNAQVAHVGVTVLGHDSSEFQDDDETFDVAPPAAGHHLIIDLMGASRLDDLAHVERTLRRCVEASGAKLLHVHLQHTTPGGGVSGVAVLADSHISIYTRPHAGFAALDVFASNGAELDRVTPILRKAFRPREIVTRLMERGCDVNPQVAATPAAQPKPLQDRKALPAATSRPERLRKTG